MDTFILVVQTIFALMVTGLILIQSKGTGFGRAWGGGSSFTRRGLERLVFKATFVFSAIFIIISITAYVI
ncbi:preprotein translocase subunit SecG [Candidatus Woesebacteria bacterium]|nr:MAG: preprotein translocase subunit SecG [Candidatus Woesebacteria bacterium]